MEARDPRSFGMTISGSRKLEALSATVQFDPTPIRRKRILYVDDDASSGVRCPAIRGDRRAGPKLMRSR